MSQARCNARRRRQAANRFAHMPPRKRPNYRQKHLMSIGAAIEAERRHAAAEARRKTTKK